MPESVRKAVADAAVRYGGLDAEDAGEWVRNLEREGRLLEECWS